MHTYYQSNLTRKESKTLRSLLTVSKNSVLKSVFMEVVTLSLPQISLQDYLSAVPLIQLSRLLCLARLKCWTGFHVIIIIILPFSVCQHLAQSLTALAGLWTSRRKELKQKYVCLFICLSVFRRIKDKTENCQADFHEPQWGNGIWAKNPFNFRAGLVHSFFKPFVTQISDRPSGLIL